MITVQCSCDCDELARSTTDRRFRRRPRAAPRAALWRHRDVGGRAASPCICGRGRSWSSLAGDLAARAALPCPRHGRPLPAVLQPAAADAELPGAEIHRLDAGTSYATFRAALTVLDAIAELKRTDAILCDAANMRICDRCWRGSAGSRTSPSAGSATSSRRFYGVYPAGSMPQSASTASRCWQRCSRRSRWQCELLRSASDLAAVAVGCYRSPAFRRCSCVDCHSPRQGFVAVSHVCPSSASLRARAAVLAAAGCSQIRVAPHGQQAAVTLSPAADRRSPSRRSSISSGPRRSIATIRSSSRCWPSRGSRLNCSKSRSRATQTQLRDTTDQLAAMQTDNDQLRNRTSRTGRQRAARAARPRFAPTTACCATSRSRNMPGIKVRQDGDVVRIELPGRPTVQAGHRPAASTAPSSCCEASPPTCAQNYPQQHHRHRRPHRRQPDALAAVSDRPASGGRPGDGRVRRA